SSQPPHTCFGRFALPRRAPTACRELRSSASRGYTLRCPQSARSFRDTIEHIPLREVALLPQPIQGVPDLLGTRTELKLKRIQFSRRAQRTQVRYQLGRNICGACRAVLFRRPIGAIYPQVAVKQTARERIQSRDRLALWPQELRTRPVEEFRLSIKRDGRLPRLAKFQPPQFSLDGYKVCLGAACAAAHDPRQHQSIAHSPPW